MATNKKKTTTNNTKLNTSNSIAKTLAAKNVAASKAASANKKTTTTTKSTGTKSTGASSAKSTTASIGSKDSTSYSTKTNNNSSLVNTKTSNKKTVSRGSTQGQSTIQKNKYMSSEEYTPFGAYQVRQQQKKTNTGSQYVGKLINEYAKNAQTAARSGKYDYDSYQNQYDKINDYLNKYGNTQFSAKDLYTARKVLNNAYDQIKNVENTTKSLMPGYNANTDRSKPQSTNDLYNTGARTNSMLSKANARTNQNVQDQADLYYASLGGDLSNASNLQLKALQGKSNYYNSKKTDDNVSKAGKNFSNADQSKVEYLADTSRNHADRTQREENLYNYLNQHGYKTSEEEVSDILNNEPQNTRRSYTVQDTRKQVDYSTAANNIQNELDNRAFQLKYATKYTNDDWNDNNSYDSAASSKNKYLTWHRDYPDALKQSQLTDDEKAQLFFDSVNGDERAYNALHTAYTSDGTEVQLSNNGSGVEKYMTDDEVEMFNYLYNSEGKESAMEYYSGIENTLNQRLRAAEQAKLAQDVKDPLKAAEYSLLSVATQPLATMANIAMDASDLISKGSINTYDPRRTYTQEGNVARSLVSDEFKDLAGGEGTFLGDLAGLGYEAGMSALDNLFGLGIGQKVSSIFGLTGQAASRATENMVLGLMGTTSAVSGIQSNLEAGMDTTSAITLGVGAGAIEVLTEKIGMDNLFNSVWKGKNAWVSWAKQVLSEGSEEVLGSAMNDALGLAYDAVTGESKSDFNREINQYILENGLGMNAREEAFQYVLQNHISDALMQGAAGAISGGMLGSAALANNLYVTNNTVKAVSVDSTDTESVRTFAMSAIESSETGSKTNNAALELLNTLPSNNDTPAFFTPQNAINKVIRNGIVEGYIDTNGYWGNVDAKSKNTELGNSMGLYNEKNSPFYNIIGTKAEEAAELAKKASRKDYEAAVNEAKKTAESVRTEIYKRTAINEAENAGATPFEAKSMVDSFVNDGVMNENIRKYISDQTLAELNKRAIGARNSAFTMDTSNVPTDINTPSTAFPMDTEEGNTPARAFPMDNTKSNTPAKAFPMSKGDSNASSAFPMDTNKGSRDWGFDFDNDDSILDSDSEAGQFVQTIRNQSFDNTASIIEDIVDENTSTAYLQDINSLITATIRNDLSNVTTTAIDEDTRNRIIAAVIKDTSDNTVSKTDTESSPDGRTYYKGIDITQADDYKDFQSEDIKNYNENVVDTFSEELKLPKLAQAIFDNIDYDVADPIDYYVELTDAAGEISKGKKPQEIKADISNKAKMALYSAYTKDTATATIKAQAETLDNTKEESTDGGEVSLSGISGRADMQNTRIKSKGMDGGSETTQSTGRFSSPERRADEINSIIRTGERKTAFELGLKNGSKGTAVNIISNESNADLKAASKLASEHGFELVAFADNNLKFFNGEVSARGAVDLDNKKIYIRGDHRNFNAFQLTKHEDFHAYLSTNTQTKVNNLMKQLDHVIGHDNMNAIVDMYKAAYAGSDLTEADILEEMLCDFSGQMDIFSGALADMPAIRDTYNRILEIASQETNKFTLETPVEETKNLIALHNLIADNLKKDIKLGGFAVPSIAVTRPDLLHDGYGDITLVMNKSTAIPEANPNNVTFLGNAGSPMVTIHDFVTNEEKKLEFLNYFYDLDKEFKLSNYDMDDLRNFLTDYENKYARYRYDLLHPEYFDEDFYDFFSGLSESKFEDTKKELLDYSPVELMEYFTHSDGLSKLFLFETTRNSSYFNLDSWDLPKIDEKQYKKWFVDKFDNLLIPNNITLDELTKKQAMDTKRMIHSGVYFENLASMKEKAPKLNENWKYYEAKPMRTVKFDEVLAAVLPSDADSDLANQLREVGVNNILVYEAGNNTDRLKKINSVEDAKFSRELKLNSEQKENIRESASNIKLKGRKYSITATEAKKIAKEIIQSSMSDIKPASIAADIQYLTTKITEEYSTFDDVKADLIPIARKIVESSSTTEGFDDVQAIRNDIRNTKLFISEKTKKDFTDYNEMRKSHFGSVSLSLNSGKHLSDFADEMYNTYGSSFDIRDMTESDQLQYILDFVDDNKKKTVNPYGDQIEEGIQFVANQLYDSMINATLFTPSELKNIDSLYAPDRWTTTLNKGSKKTAENIMPLSDIVAKLKHDYGIHITVGQVRGKNVNGVYNRKNKGVKVKIANNLPTISHEFGHGLDDKYSLIPEKINDLPKDLVKELNQCLGEEMAVNYNAKERPFEGLAEFIRKYWLSRDEATAKYPTITKWLMGNMSGKDRMIFEQFADEINGYLAFEAESATDTIRLAEQGGKDFRTIMEKVKDKYSSWYRSMVDAMAPLKEFDREVGSNVYKAAINSQYSDAIAGEIIFGDLTDIHGQYVAPGLGSALEGINVQNKKEYMEFGEYLICKHAPEWLESGKRVYASEVRNNVGWVNRRAAELEQKYPKFKDAANKLYQFQTDLMKTWGINTGILDAGLYATLQEKYPNYVPMFRVMEKGNNTHSAKRGFANQNSPIKMAKGSGLDIIHPVDSIASNIAVLVNAGKRNDVMLQLTDAADKLGANANFMEKINTPMVGHKVFGDTIRQGLKKNAENLDFEIDNLDDIIDQLSTDMVQFEKGRAKGDVVTVLKHGKQEFWKINDPALLESVASLAPKKLSGLLNAYAKITRFLTANITGNNPIWSIFSNAPRDLGTFIGYFPDKKKLGQGLRSIGSAYINSFKANKTNSTTVDPMYREYLAMGGGHTSMYSADTDLAKKARKHFSQTKAQKVWEKLNPLEWLTFLTDTIEQGPRYATYRTLRLNGASAEEAFYQAMDITTNFRKAGTMSREINKVVPFFNASIQGVDKFARYFSAADVKPADRAKAIRTRVSIFAAVSAALAGVFYALNCADPDKEKEYKQLSNYTKNNFWLIPLGDGKYFAIPKPRELAVPTSLFERVLETTAGENAHAFDEFYGYAVDNFLPSILSDVAKLPEAIAEDGLDTAISDTVSGALGNLGIIGVGVDLAANRDFLGRSIESTSLQNYEAKDRYTDSTSWLAKTIGSAFNLSPQKIDYAGNNILGYIWKIQKALFPVGSSKRDLTLGVANTYVKDNLYSTDITNWIYDKADKSSLKANSNPTDADIQYTAKMDSSMTSFYGKFNGLNKGNESTANQRAAKQTVADMIYEYQRATDNNLKTDAEKAVIKAVDEAGGDTSNLPAVMSTYVTDAQKNRYDLTDAQYVEYQTMYNAEYWNYIEDHLDNLTTDVMKEAKSTAKTNATNAVLKSMLKDSDSYKTTYNAVTATSTYKNASASEKEDIEELIDEYEVYNSKWTTSAREAVDAGAMTATEYILFMNALQKNDEPTEKGVYGTYTKNEQLEAIADMKWSDAKASSVWEYLPNDSKNPYKDGKTTSELLEKTKKQLDKVKEEKAKEKSGTLSSSFLGSYTYKDGVLNIQVSGRWYQYNISEETFNGLVNASSPGRYFNAYIG